MTDIIEGQYRALAVREETAPAVQPFFGAMRPAEKIAYATEIADALKPILTQKKLVHKLNRQNPDDEYVELEGWQTCGNLCGVTAKVEWTRPLADGSGYEARAIVIRVDNGIEIGGGESVCSRAEQKWKTRDDYAIKGMAQTRAQSRALRGVLAWILVLAGYKPTPAEEMPDLDDKPLRRDEPAKPKDATQAQHDEIHALAQSLGIPKTRAWIAANVVPGFDKEKRSLNVVEYAMVKAALTNIGRDAAGTAEGAVSSPHPLRDDDAGSTPAAPANDDRKVTPRTNGRLFALLDERLSTEKEARLIFAAEHGVVTDSFSRITEAQARHLIAQLELLSDPSAALDAYAAERLL